MKPDAHINVGDRILIQRKMCVDMIPYIGYYHHTDKGGLLVYWRFGKPFTPSNLEKIAWHEVEKVFKP